MSSALFSSLSLAGLELAVGSKSTIEQQVLGHLAIEALTAAGATVMGVGRDPERLAASGAATSILADLRDPAAVSAAVTDAAADGPLDVVVNAVGVVAFGNVADPDADTVEELFLTNAFVPMFAATSAIGHMAPGGVFCTISGVIAEQNLPGMAAYGASKAAGRSFAEGFAREARRAKVRVLDARPGHTETGLATRPLAGVAPKMADGLAPRVVAERIVVAVERGEAVVGPGEFTSH